MAEIKLLDVSKTYDVKEVLNDINIEIKEGEMISLLGPSGCGKTTLLKIIAGLEPPSGGKIFFNGVDMTSVEPNRRSAIIVFQDYRLFPHMTVFENIEFPLKIRKVCKAERNKLINEMLELTQLVGLERSYPSNISGGQKQRVALARALIVKPEILLLDEPFSNLDTSLRESMREFIMKLQKDLKFTAVLVTHDKEEAFIISDRVAVLINGELQQFDEPLNIYGRPKTKVLADFIGEANYIKGSVKNGFFESSLGRISCNTYDDKENAELMVRYHQIELTREETGISCEVLDKRFGGREIFYRVKVNDTILALVSANNNFNVSDKAFILLKESEFIIY